MKWILSAARAIASPRDVLRGLEVARNGLLIGNEGSQRTHSAPMWKQRFLIRKLFLGGGGGGWRSEAELQGGAFVLHVAVADWAQRGFRKITIQQR